MVKKILLPTIAILFFISANAQKKMELFAEINSLKQQKDSLMNQVNEAKRNERASAVKTESYKKQVAELQDANATLMKNLTTFTSVSAKNSDNFTKAMQSLQEKEAQLRGINEALAKNDSTSLVVLTNAKQTLGENAKIGISKNSIVISSSLTALFENDQNAVISEQGELWLQKIANILLANPDFDVNIEGLSMTGDLVLPAQQANAISSALQTLGISANRISALGRDGDLKEGVLLKLHPKYAKFYDLVKEHMKQSN